jgi:rod shape-determining protein MreD
MRRHIIAGVVILLLAVAESSLLVALLGSSVRPNLVLLTSATWVAIRGNEGLLWALGGGLLLDFQSGAPFGVHTAGIAVGNLLAMLLDRTPAGLALVRTLNWVLVVSAAYYIVAIVVLTVAGRNIGAVDSLTNVALPSTLINLLLALPAHAVLSRLQARLREQERFLPER